MGQYLSGDDFDAMQLPEDDVVVTGGMVRVRGLAHDEAVALIGEDGEYVDKVISLGLVKPKRTVEQVAAWRKRAGAYDLRRVHLRIEQLSGRDAEADARAYKSLRGASDAVVGALPGGEVRDDGDEAAAGDL